jgi:D-lyxose ketol-isomerase
MNRRELLRSLTLGTAGIMTVSFRNPVFAQQNRRNGNANGNANARRRREPLVKHPNDHFYRDGKFDQETAKKAYAELFQFHNYSLRNVILDHPDFWMLEFGQNDFSNVGMGGIFFVNDKEHSYFGHEIYLLPGQMIAEHFHLPAEDMPAKHEAWQVRHGSVWTVAQGGDKSKLPFVLPKSQEQYATCFDAKELKVGGQDALRKLDEPHFMMAGPEGAIVTEYASYHSGAGLRFTNPTVKI